MQQARWFTLELATDGDLHDALEWLARAYDAGAGKGSKVELRWEFYVRGNLLVENARPAAWVAAVWGRGVRPGNSVLPLNCRCISFTAKGLILPVTVITILRDRDTTGCDVDHCQGGRTD